MRTPADFPRRRRAPRTTGRGRAWLVVLAVALFVLLTSLRGIAGFYTDYLWFDSLGKSGVFTGVLWAKIVLGTIFTAIFFVLLWLNLFIADRIAPRFRPAGPEEEVIERYRELIGNRTGLVRGAVSGLFAIIAGAGVSAQWDSWILFTNAQTVGVRDQQFDVDVGFYLFRLPFLSFLVDWTFASLVIVLIVVAVAHYLNGGIRVSGPGQRVTPQVKAHLSVLLGLLALLRAAGYWLARYELTFSERGAVRGATYTDVNAQLPALELLAVISLAAFVLLIVNIWRRGWVLPVLAVGLWAFTAVVVGGIYPAFVQRFTVEPSESARERPYIERNIAATRAAVGLDEVTETPFRAEDAIDAEAIARNQNTIRNIRLWDPGILQDTYEGLQEIRQQYAIRDVDVDRYEVDGQMTQVLVSARELDTPQVPQRSWEGLHLTYTHGYGVVAAPANAKSPDGGPSFLVQDVPPQTDVPSLTVEEPGLYIGEGLEDYVITNTKRREIDYQDTEGQTVFSTYGGADGVGVGSYLRRAAYALRFGDINPLVSGNLQDDSRILYIRDVRERVQTLAPFLDFDADPYPVIVGGRTLWVVDAYTTSNSYPYAESADREQLPQGSGLDHNFNYVRNSVKAVVDAYDGTVTFYVVDDQDPIIRAYRGAFPELFTDGAEAPAELRAHFRYPEDLFRVQTNMWGRYHLSDPDDFYNFADAWNVAQDPGTSGATPATQQIDPQTQQPVGSPRQARIEPYYLLMQLPGEEEASFVLLRPFVPRSEDDSRQQLTAFMVAKSDPEDYGQLQTFVMDPADLPDGPQLVASRIRSQESVSQLETLLGQGGSDLLFGSLILIPIDQSLLYVRPMYVQDASNEIPLLRRVIVEYEGRVAVEETLDEALRVLFPGAVPNTQEEPAEGGEGPPDEPQAPQEPGEELVGGDVASLLAQAEERFEQAEAALAEGDLGRYQKLVDEAVELVRRARALADPEGATSTTSTTSTSTPSTTEPPTA